MSAAPFIRVDTPGFMPDLLSLEAAFNARALLDAVTAELNAGTHEAMAAAIDAFNAPGRAFVPR